MTASPTAQVRAANACGANLIGVAGPVGSGLDGAAAEAGQVEDPNR